MLLRIVFRFQLHVVNIFLCNANLAVRVLFVMSSTKFLYLHSFNLCIFVVMYSYFMFMYLNRDSWRSSATLTEVFPCFFLSCKSNARV